MTTIAIDAGLAGWTAIVNEGSSCVPAIEMLDGGSGDEENENDDILATNVWPVIKKLEAFGAGVNPMAEKEPMPTTTATEAPYRFERFVAHDCGWRVTSAVGDGEGTKVGESVVGSFDGSGDGSSVASTEGSAVGSVYGAEVGTMIEWSTGDATGACVGLAVGPVQIIAKS